MLNTWESNMSCYVWLSAERTLRGNADFFISKAPGLTRGRARFKHGGMLALLKYPFYPLFIFDNGMNLISKSLTILTSAWLLVVFAFAHIFWRYFVFAGFWLILEHEMARPTITRWHEERQGQSPNKGSKAMMIRGPFMHIHPPMKPKRQSPQDKIKILRG